MSPAFGDAIAELPPLLQAHFLLSGCAVLIGLAIGLPLALWAQRSIRVHIPVLAIVGLVQTIPALALLALFYPLLLAAGNLSGFAIPALGFLPSLLALAVYALLPIVRNGMAALSGIDPNILEAADGVGMTQRQRLLLIELPLGAPVILAGIRIAAAWTIGAATLATTVGQPTLGNLIFSGLQTENWARVLVGCMAAAALALIVDGLLALVEAGLSRRSIWRIVAGVGALAILAVAAFIPLSAFAKSNVVIVGAKNFSEQYILAEAIEARLHAAGYDTQRRDDLGSAIAYRALAAGDIDVYVDYSGTLWTNVLRRTDVLPAEKMRQLLAQALRQRDKVGLLGPLGFENAYALAMKSNQARALGIHSLEDLAKRAPELRLASDIEFLTRPEWRSVQRSYDLRFADMRSYNPTFMYRAISDGTADIISAFSSDGRIAAMNLVTLSDPRHALPSYDAILLVAPARTKDERFIAALNPLVGAIDIRRMRLANMMVDRDRDKRTPRQAARWLLATP